MIPVNFHAEHIGLAAANPELIKDWCLKALGAELVFSDGKKPPAFFVRFPGSQGALGLMIEIYASESALQETGNNSLAGWRHLALRVDSIEAARDLLVKRGVEFQPLIKPAGGGGRVLFFKDPEGNLWHLVERPASEVFAHTAN
jgi:glyoxylase I family protein